MQPPGSQRWVRGTGRPAEILRPVARLVSMPLPLVPHPGPASPPSTAAGGPRGKRLPPQVRSPFCPASGGATSARAQAADAEPGGRVPHACATTRAGDVWVEGSAPASRGPSPRATAQRPRDGRAATPDSRRRRDERAATRAGEGAAEAAATTRPGAANAGWAPRPTGATSEHSIFICDWRTRPAAPRTEPQQGETRHPRPCHPCTSRRAGTVRRTRPPRLRPNGNATLWNTALSRAPPPRARPNHDRRRPGAHPGTARRPGQDTPISEVASLLEEKRIKRVPVVRDGKVVGIIGRANFVRALATAPELHRNSNETDDRHIRERLLAELKRQDWARVWPEDIQATGGVVHFWLPDDMPSAEIDALRIAAEKSQGCGRSKCICCSCR